MTGKAKSMTDRCYAKNPAIIERHGADGPVLIDPYRRMMITLNPAALEAWRLLDGTRPVADIVAALGEQFEVGERELARDIEAFLKELVKREMVCRCSAV